MFILQIQIFHFQHSVQSYRKGFSMAIVRARTSTILNGLEKLINQPNYKFTSSGLVLHLDVGNSTSYPGSGTTVTDLTGNGYNMTLVGPTYTSTNGGGISFNTTSDYADGTNITPNYGNFTIEIVLSMSRVYVGSTSWHPYGSVGIMAVGASGTGLAGGTWLTFSITDKGTSLDLYGPNNNYPGWKRNEFIPYNFVPNKTYTISYVNSGTNLTVYVNGKSIGSIDLGYIGRDGVRLALMRDHVQGINGAPGGVFYQARVYNRALSSQEVLNNYEVFAGRYKS